MEYVSIYMSVDWYTTSVSLSPCKLYIGVYTRSLVPISVLAPALICFKMCSTHTALALFDRLQVIRVVGITNVSRFMPRAPNTFCACMVLSYMQFAPIFSLFEFSHMDTLGVC